MKQITNIILALLTSLLFSSVGRSQEVSFTTSSPAEVGVGLRFQITFTVSAEGNVANFRAPAFQNANIMAGPMSGSRTSISNINGKISRTQQTTFTYHLSAPAMGTVTIPPASIDVDGKTYRTETRTIKVQKSDPQTATSGQQRPTSQNNPPGKEQAKLDDNSLFLRASVSKTNAVKGEELIISYKIYTSVGVSEYQINKLPINKGFWTEDLTTRGTTPQVKEEMLNGRRYNVFELQRIAAYPQTEGKLLIEPMEVEINAVVANRTSRSTGSIFDIFDDPFFGGMGGYQKIPKTLKSNSIVVNVAPLPAEPKGFQGAVGNFSLNSTIDSAKIRSNEPITIRYTVSGTGNLQLINELQTNFPRDFEVYAPKISDKISRSANGISGSRTFEYILIPRLQGEYTLPSISLIYFDLKTKTYKTLTTTSYQIHVAKGDQAPSSTALFLSEKEKYRTQDISYIMMSKRNIKAKSFFIVSSWFWGVIAGCTLLFFATFFWLQRRDIARKDVHGTRWRQSYRMAKKRMSSAKKKWQKNEKENFYTAVSQAIWGYLADKFRIDRAKLSMETIQEIWLGKGLKAEHIDSIIQTLEQCEYARFAPDSQTESMSEMYNKALELIARVEAQEK